MNGSSGLRASDPSLERVVDADKVRAALDHTPPHQDVEDLADVFGLLSEPGRLRLLMALLEGELCVSDLSAVADLSESSTSHALRILRAHRVVTVRRSGRMAYYRLADAHVRMLLELAVAHVQHTELMHHHDEGQP